MLIRFLKQWIIVIMAFLIAAVAWLWEAKLVVSVVLCLGIAFNSARLCYKDNEALGKITFVGILVGVATMLWSYSAIGLVLLMFYMYGPLKLFSPRMTLALVIGFATPFWCWLPYWFFTNIDFVTEKAGEYSNVMERFITETMM